MTSNRFLPVFLFLAEATFLITALDCDAQTGIDACPTRAVPADAAYTIQVSAFPSQEMAEKFAETLTRAGERPVCVQVEIPGRGIWTRVMTGAFQSLQSARRYGRALIAKGVANEFLIRSLYDVASSTAGQGMSSEPSILPSVFSDPAFLITAPRPLQLIGNNQGTALPLPHISLNRIEASFDCVATAFVPTSAIPLFYPDNQRIVSSIARPSPALMTLFDNRVNPAPSDPEGPSGLALSEMTDAGPQKTGGLWLAGDIQTGLSLLESIVGPENASALAVDSAGRVQFDAGRLPEAPGSSGPPGAQAAVDARHYISRNEGLLLLAQILDGPYKYQFNLGDHSDTGAGCRFVASALNLDPLFDLRINPRRKKGRKLPAELPPDGFDSLVAINPASRWMNVGAGRAVPLWIIAFHELAEAYSKVALGLQYLPAAANEGAHELALKRESILRSERPSDGLVLTDGTNVVFRSDREMARYMELNLGGSR
ncbi:MAG TPA: SPOR domain-containing protein [Blastocatellia bacterium]